MGYIPPTQTRIPAPNMCIAQESKFVSVSMSGNVFKPLELPLIVKADDCD